MPPTVRLPTHLQDAVWQHVQRALPNESVGVFGARSAPPDAEEDAFDLRAFYPLRNIAPDPARTYLADPTGLLRALRAMQQDGLTLGGIYHSHPHGPARPSRTDLNLAQYRVPYLIADPERRELRAYLLPENLELPLDLS